MKAQIQKAKLILSVIAVASAYGCAPAATSSALTAPQQATGVVNGPTNGSQPFTTDVSDKPVIGIFMGSYSGSLVRQLGGGVTTVRSFTMTMTRRQNTTGQGVSAYATLDLKVAATSTEPEINQALYVGVDPTPYGLTYNLMTNSFTASSLSTTPVALRMLLSIKQTGQNPQDVASYSFDPASSEAYFYDCGISSAACLNKSTQVQIGTIKKL